MIKRRGASLNQLPLVLMSRRHYARAALSARKLAPRDN